MRTRLTACSFRFEATPRRILCGVLFTIGWLASSGVAQAAAAEPDRPNILWITCEDISPHLGCYGEESANTPNIDRLATQGVRYTQAFSVSGVCAPSRSCIITGMYPTSIGTHHMRCRAVLPDSIRCFTQPLRAAGYYCTNNVKTDYNFQHPPTTWDESSRTAHWRGRNSGQPFFAVFNITTTHESRVRADDEQFSRLTSRLSPADRQDPKKLTLPPYYPDTPIVRKDWAHYFELITAMDMQVGDILNELEQDGLAESTVVFFYSDHGVGLPRAKRWLYDSGLQIPMIVRWPNVLKAGSSDDRLVSFVDLAPTVLSMAGIEIPEPMQGHAFLGRRAAEPRQYIYAARDRMDERYDLIRAVRDKRYKYIRNYQPWKPYAQYLNYAEVGPTMQELRRLAGAGQLAGPPARFMQPGKPVEELYDLEQDPHEIHNLAADPEFEDVLDRLRAAHVDWAQRTIDTGYLPEPELLELAGSEGIYSVARHSEVQESIEHVREAAATISSGVDSETLLRLLQDGNPSVRYWAAVGLDYCGEDDQRTHAALNAALDDASASVRIAAARGLCRRNESERSLPVLIRELHHSEDAVRILAANALDSLGERTRPAIENMRPTLKDESKYVGRIINHTLNELLGTSNRVP